MCRPVFHYLLKLDLNMSFIKYLCKNEQEQATCDRATKLKESRRNDNCITTHVQIVVGCESEAEDAPPA